MTTQKGKQVISNINIGGISDSRYSGVDGSQYEIQGLNIHEEPGVIKVQQDTKLDTGVGVTPDEKIISIIPAANNLTYYFGSGGTVWTRNSSSTYALLGAIPSGSAYGVINDAKEFNGDLYYTMQERVGKYTPGDSWNTSTTDGTQNNFKNIEFDSFHPMKVVENDLYVGHTNHAGKITPAESAGGDIIDVLTFDTDFTVESFGVRISNLVIGTRAVGTAAGTFAAFSHIFEWDLVSATWTREQQVEEFGISAFFKLSGALLFNAGNKGMLYSWDGSSAQQFKRIPGDWSGSNSARILKNATSSYDSRLAFGLSNESGDPAAQGIYTLGGYDAKYPKVFNLEFIPESGTTTGTEIHACARIGTDFIFSYSTASVKRINIVDTANKIDTSYFITREIAPDRDNLLIDKVRVCYRSLPSGTTITLKVNKNDADPTFTGSVIPLIKHANKKYLESSINIASVASIQFKVIVTSNGNNAPEIENLTILF